jgi:hypothetical protein
MLLFVVFDEGNVECTDSTTHIRRIEKVTRKNGFRGMSHYTKRGTCVLSERIVIAYRLKYFLAESKEWLVRLQSAQNRYKEVPNSRIQS